MASLRGECGYNKKEIRDQLQAAYGLCGPPEFPCRIGFCGELRRLPGSRKRSEQPAEAECRIPQAGYPRSVAYGAESRQFTGGKSGIQPSPPERIDLLQYVLRDRFGTGSEERILIHPGGCGA